VRLWESQYNVARPRLADLLGNQVRPLLRKFAAEDPGDVEQRAAAAHEANVMRAVTNYIAFGAQNGIL
jgi:hypothetical protein